MPAPARTHLPIKQYIADSGILEDDGIKDDVDVALLRLPAPGLRGTFAQAYTLLAKLVSVIGWDELLKTRSAVFVMEEEYRAQKATMSMQEVANGQGKVIMEDGSVRESTDMNGKTADDDASIRAMNSPHETELIPPPYTNANGSATATPTHLSSENIPVIKVSSESDRGDDTEAASIPPSSPDLESVRDDESDGGQVITIGATAGDSVSKPTTAAAPPADEEAGPEGPERTRSPRLDHKANAVSDGFSFSNKRLCERWLDNLFMVLYEVRHADVVQTTISD